jgi:hypothetical protein
MAKVGDGNEGCTITVANNTGYQMTLSSSREDHGYFTQTPPTDIVNKQSPVIKAKGADSSMTGCDIGFVYVIGDSSQTTVTWAYEKPYDGINSYSITITGPMAQNYTVATSPAYNPSHDDWLTTTTTITPNTAKKK